MGAHCSCPTKLNGFDSEPEPFILRDHHESETGVSPQVLWHKDKEVTVMEFDGPGKIIVGTGKVTRQNPLKGTVVLEMEDGKELHVTPDEIKRKNKN